MVIKEPEENKKDAERLANWKANFPYKPATDPDMVITEEMLEKGYGHTPVFRNHGYSRHFFENKTRFTAQFQQLYNILEEHGREDNSMAAGDIFECLRLYQEYMQKATEGQSTACSHTMKRHLTNAEAAEGRKEAILGELQSEKVCPTLGGMPETEAVALRDRIINEIQGLDKLPASGAKDHFVINMDYVDKLEVRVSPLVISHG